MKDTKSCTVSGDQSGTWTLANSSYIVDGSVTVPENLTLTIEPGVVVKFNGWYSLTVKGTLIADGTLSDNITFTSNLASPAPGNWQCVYFPDTTHSVMDYCIVEYGGGWGYANIYIGNGFNSLSGFCTITNCTIRNSYYDGIRIDNNSSPIIFYNTKADSYKMTKKLLLIR